jgi:hypothetical protein
VEALGCPPELDAPEELDPAPDVVLEPAEELAPPVPELSLPVLELAAAPEELLAVELAAELPSDVSLDFCP